MRYYKNIQDGYIVAIGQGLGYDEISENEYNEIISISLNKPQAEQGYDYRLKEDLTWEMVKVHIEESEGTNNEI